jgi:Ser/Thr protein kinase RdoA (MazF antagonist)
MSILAAKPLRAEFGWPGGDRPGALEFRIPVPVEVRAAILAAAAPVLRNVDDSTEITALAPIDGAIGRYRLATPNAAYFLRVSARLGDAELEQSITSWLQRCEIAVNHLEVAGISLEFAGNLLRLDVRELLEARHDDGSIADLQKVAAAVADCHRALRTFPRADEVRSRAAARFQNLGKVRDAIAQALVREDWSAISDHPGWAKAHREWLKEMIGQFQPRFDLMPGAQCLHAQVHRGNVLFRRSDGAPVLVDFEEAVQTFAPVAWDLAYFVQRFCLADVPSEEALRQRLDAARSAYGAPVLGLADMMRQTSWFSMAILVDYHTRGIASPQNEFDKFVHLEREAARLAPLLGKTFDV